MLSPEEERLLDESRYAEREDEGRCGRCGAFQGPDHFCPHLQQLRNKIWEGSARPWVGNNRPNHPTK